MNQVTTIMQQEEIEFDLTQEEEEILRARHREAYIDYVEAVQKTYGATYNLLEPPYRPALEAYEFVCMIASYCGYQVVSEGYHQMPFLRKRIKKR
ncbi:hypothetical protein [Dictyobacter kobayashii]|nr:hypothetical protein [Dictyobacter kobayashii]